MAWFQRAKDKATIRDLEAELAQRSEKYAALIDVISDALVRLRQGATGDAVRFLDAQYRIHRLVRESWRKARP